MTPKFSLGKEPETWKPWSKGSREQKSLDKCYDGVEEMNVDKEAIDVVQKNLTCCVVILCLSAVL